ncbi:PREDICTED: uncharacterized protein LOC108704637 isoform X2 [Pelobates cultripes]|uniref:PREDICTED: uncharacterized protein LOC108704637 isoform X2 n=2 Tax=Pelobates cultripes TaxID=61616 RepID=A0AAD1RUE6_PELCU|nr:PREDICTED: uncharacterized protein LOC108704637 isoform X2 [Pelobates cultripes]
MGFEEAQVQAALRAGCFMVQDAADWILQKGQQHATLHTRVETEAEHGAVTAFNSPLERAPSSSSFVPSTSPELEFHPLSSSNRAMHRMAFEKKQIASLTREVREEKRSKKKDRDLVLQRIAEDRQKLQEKVQKAAAQTNQVSRGTDLPAPETGCALMVRLPSGNCIRLQFAADTLLQCVCDHVDSIQPSLAPCSLLQTFPTRHFTEQDLRCSLQELGLTPNATLCVRPQEKPCSQQQRDSTLTDPSPEPVDSICSPDDLMAQGKRLMPIMGSPAHSVSHSFTIRDELPTTPQHTWGRGQILVHREQDGVEGEQAASQGTDLTPPVSRSLSPRSHQWPSNGVRLRPSDQSNELRSPGSPPAQPGLPNLRARMAAELRQESAERVPTVSRISRVSSVPSLHHLALQGALVLITAPSMQYSRSLSGLTPELAEFIVDHMIKERVLRPRTLELFTGCPIRSLTLNCYPYCTNDLIRHLRGFPNLRTLSLSSCTLITDHGLSVIQYLHKLQYLNLSSCVKLTDLCLVYLKGLDHLSHLVLDQTKVSDDGMYDFLVHSRCSLTHLSVNQTALTERTLNLMSHRIPDLKLLSIKNTQISDVSSLSELKQLHSLHLDNTKVTEQSLLAIRSLATLSLLSLSGVQSLTSDRVLELLSGLSLTRLVLPGRRCLTVNGLSYLRHLHLLVELNLTDHTHITDQGVQHISHLARLQVLSLCNTSVTDAGLLYLRGLRHVEELSLDRTKVTSRGVSQCIPTLPHLQVLGLSDTGVGDNVLKFGIRHCKNLLKVNLSRTRITNKGLRYLRAVSVVQLNLDGTGVTAQGVSDLMASCGSIISVRANNLRQIPTADVSDEEEEIR